MAASVSPVTGTLNSRLSVADWPASTRPPLMVASPSAGCTVSMLKLSVLDVPLARLLAPSRSSRPLRLRLTLAALVARLSVGVKVAVQVWPLPSKLDRVPPMALKAVKASALKPFTGSLKWMVRVAVSPALSTLLSRVSRGTGAIVSGVEKT